MHGHKNIKINLVLCVCVCVGGGDKPNSFFKNGLTLRIMNFFL